jgi:hypothetical protein
MMSFIASLVSSSGPFPPCAEAAAPRWSLDPAFDVRVTAKGTTAAAMPLLDGLSDGCNGSIGFSDRR